MSKKKRLIIFKVFIMILVYLLLCTALVSPYLASYFYIDSLNKVIHTPINFGFKFYSYWVGHFIDSLNYGAMNEAHAQSLRVGLYAYLVPILSPIAFALFIGIISLIKRPKKSIHGNDRFANNKDLKESGFFPCAKSASKSKYPDILIGKMFEGRYKGQYVKYSGQQFLMLYAPTRSGKGVGIVIPNCLYYRDSMVVLDIKLENFRYSAGHRQKNLQQDVFMFCPEGYRNVTSDDKDAPRSHRYNPLYYISRKHSERSTDLSKISSILFNKSGGENDMWTGLSEDLFKALVLYLLDCETEVDEDGEPLKMVTLSSVYNLSIPSDGTPLGNYLKAEIEKRNSVENIKAWRDYMESQDPKLKPQYNKLDEQTVKLIYQFAEKPTKQQQNIMLTFNEKMSMFSNPVTAEATNGNDFDFKDVRRKKMTIYIGLSPDGLSMFKTLNNLFFSQLIGQNVKQGMLPEENKELQYQCLLVLDEMTSMGRVAIIEESVAFTAGYNMRYMFILQNKGQLEGEKAYKKEGASTLLENCAVEIVYPPKKVDQSVKDISETLGYYDYKTKTKSKNKSSGKNSNTSITVGETVNKRAVLLPNEIVNLRDIKHDSGISLREIILSEFCRAFQANKIIYFEEPYFLDRKIFSENNIPEIPKLSLKRDDLMEFMLTENEFLTDNREDYKDEDE